MSKESTLITEANKNANRRNFVKALSAGAAGVALASVTGTAKAQQAVTDFDILQFALNLEYLEAEFYSVATTGMTISQLGVGTGGSGTPGPTTGGKKVSFTSGLTFPARVALEIAKDERAHVHLLRSLLNSSGVTPIAKPAINLDALGIGFGSQAEFFTLARAFEDVGVTAYAGAASLLQDHSVIGYAAQILAVEALHSGNIRLQIANMNIPTSPLDSIDVLPPPSGKQFFPTDSNALVYTRTTGQVLAIVYAAANATMGGFFPNGVNGIINMSSTPA